MSELTREMIRQHCLVLRDALGNLFPSIDDPSREYYWELLDELGKTATLALTARSEGFREGVERSSKMCEESANILLGKGLRREADALSITAKSIAALSPRETDAPTREESQQDWNAVLSDRKSAPSGEVAEMVKRLKCIDTGVTVWNEAIADAAALLSKVGQGEVDALGEQPTYFEMARTRMLRKRIADIVATHDAFVADHKNKDRAHALKHAIGKARGIGLTKAEQEKQEDYDCPHAYPHRYCETCKIDPCPIGFRTPPPERP